MSQENAIAHATAAETAYRSYCETFDPALLVRATEEFEEAFEEPGDDGPWPVWRVMFGHLRCFQYDEQPTAPLLRHTWNLLSEGLDALPDDDGEQDGARTVAHLLLANAARLRYEAGRGRSVEERAALLDEALRRHTEAEPWARTPQEDPSSEPGTLLALHQGQGYLFLERHRMTADVRAARSAVTHYRAALSMPPPTEELALSWYGLGLALFAAGSTAQDRAELEAAQQALEKAFALARDTGADTGTWAWEAEIRLAAVHCCVYLAWKDHTHGEAAMADVGRLLAEPGAEDRLEPFFLHAFASVLFERAGRAADGEQQDRAVAMTRRLVREAPPGRDPVKPQRLLMLAAFQQIRYYHDQDPERAREAGRAATLALAEEPEDPETADLAEQLQVWARTMLEHRGQLTPQDETAIGAISDERAKAHMAEWAEKAENGTARLFFGDAHPDLPGMFAGLLGQQRREDDFALLYASWCEMEQGGRDRAQVAARLLNAALIADPDAVVVSEEQRDTLIEAVVETDKDDPVWQRYAHRVAGAVLLQFERGGRGRGMNEVVAHLELAGLGGPDTGDEDNYTDGFISLMARLHRGQTDGAADDMEAVGEIHRRLRDNRALPPYMATLVETGYLYFQVREAVRRADLPTMDRCIARTIAIRAGLAPDDPARTEIWVHLTSMSLRREALALRLGSAPSPLPDPPTAEELRHASLSFSPGHRAWILGDSAVGRMAFAVRDEDTEALAEARELIEEARELSRSAPPSYLRYTGLLAAAHDALARLLRVPRERDEHLELAIGLYEECYEATGGPEHRLRPSAALGLARAYRERASRRPHTAAQDRSRALALGLDGLRGYAWAALLQSATVHAAEAVAEATAEALEVASWALREGALESAVEALESCRGLALHAATTSRTVPQRLAAAGLGELADEWRAAGTGAGGTGAFQSSGEGDIPSALRRRVLTALRADATDSGDRLLDPPGIAAVAEALRTLGRDALVYLVPTSDEGSGSAVVVTAGGETHVLPLPALDEQAGPLAQYAPVPGGGRDLGPVPGAPGTAAGRPPAGPELRRQLDRLCGWAWYAAMRPLLDVFSAPGRPDRIPRLVLVPMGRLGLVPWHAAYRPAAGGRRRYALQDADLSYAASARLLCEVAARPAAARAGDTLVVGDPTGDLVYAGEEADAVQRLFYPDGRFVGRRRGGAADGAGTPDEVLDWLRGNGSQDGVLHLACHASVTDNARRSAGLSLHGGDLFAEDLTAAGGDTGSAGPALVLLAACRSNVSGHGDNEAFTLATAFLVAGARSVVGSLWPVPDEATSVLMLLTHYFLSREQEPPARALRRAQLWMLGLDRQPPGSLPDELAARAARVDPDDLSAWAGFTHLGR
ncbi:CHAT domain-containing protein [Streptomyces sp. SID4919]|uniref:CHAT domain-containing protein n=1 Tax=unclassified Streptomyces TaxID=2593676 RepID=UPI0008239C01|nr:CHAT domain-containing protein [Streptomyces sp. AmelKG-E11A]MYY08140.1 CHAT domain-containing protein [Streptomyces sp. SID4919]SCK09338.1 CHAT domain-containing protein [Streptomyces sp. AmelKG-E11A]